MLGWRVNVIRKVSGSSPGEPKKLVLASWQTSLYGIRWLEDLVKEGKAADLGGNGYPKRYSMPANVLLPIITAGLPANDSPPVLGDDYFLPEGWSGKVNLDHQQISECPGDDQLLIEAWDQS